MPNLLEAKTLREDRKANAEKMRGLVEVAAQEERSLTAEENMQFDALDEKVVDLAASIEKIERCVELDRELSGLKDLNAEADYRANHKTAPDTRVTSEDRQNALRAWALHPYDGNGEIDVPQAWRDSAAKCGVKPGKDHLPIQLMAKAPKSVRDVREAAEAELRAATTSAQTITTTGGGNVVQNEAMQALEIALIQHGGVRNFATVLRTNSGATLPLPTLDDTSTDALATILAINTGADVQALIFGQVTMSAYKYTTKQVLVPLELMQDSNFDVAQIIGEAFGVRFARGTNLHFTVGVSSDTQPSGYVTDSAAGSTGADVNTISYANYVDLQHSLDPAYRPGAIFTMNDDTLKATKKLVDGDSRPLWSAGFSAGDPDTILGKPYVVNQDVVTLPSATTSGGVKAVTFGAMDRYKIREVRGIQIARSDQRYIELAQTVFIGFGRFDGVTVQASTVQAPIVHYVTKSS